VIHYFVFVSSNPRLESPPLFAASLPTQFPFWNLPHLTVSLLESAICKMLISQALSFQNLNHNGGYGGGAAMPNLKVLLEVCPDSPPHQQIPTTPRHIPGVRLRCLQAPPWIPLSPLDATPMRHLAKCCKQKAYVSAKSFRCNTYTKHGGRGPALSFLTTRHSPLATASQGPKCPPPALN
jgi:hypothetical protein